MSLLIFLSHCFDDYKGIERDNHLGRLLWVCLHWFTNRQKYQHFGSYIVAFKSISHPANGFIKLECVDSNIGTAQPIFPLIESLGMCVPIEAMSMNGKYSGKWCVKFLHVQNEEMVEQVAFGTKVIPSSWTCIVLPSALPSLLLGGNLMVALQDLRMDP